MDDSDRLPTEPGAIRATPATIYDVARAAGVSASAVSRGLNQPGRLSASTERRIREAAASLHYRSNPLARALPTGRTGTIALIVSDFTNPVYFDLVRGAEQVVSASDRTLIVAESHESAEAELETAERLTPAVDGMILVASRLGDDDIRALAARKSLVVVNRAVAGVAGLVPDVLPGIAAALDAVEASGDRRVAWLPGPASSFMSRLRGDALAAMCRERGMPLNVLDPAEPNLAGGERALARIIDSGAETVFAYNDLIALGLLRACRAHGIVVPDRLGIVGFDDIFGADLTTPGLATVASPLHEMGVRAVGLIEGGGDSDDPPLATRFVPRGSVAAPALG